MSNLVILLSRFVVVYFSLWAVSNILKLREKISGSSLFISLAYGLLYPLTDILIGPLFTILITMLMLFYLVNKYYDGNSKWTTLCVVCLVSLLVFVLTFIFSMLLLSVGIRKPIYY
jgi:hypothetical protein